MDPRDQWHALALYAMNALSGDRRPMVTTNLVLLESYTGLVGRIARTAIARLHDAVQRSVLIRVERIDVTIEEMAWQMFLRHDDKTFSMTDCTSFIVMEQLGLDTAFAFDRHFRQAGFRTLPEAA